MTWIQHVDNRLAVLAKLSTVPTSMKAAGRPLRSSARLGAAYWSAGLRPDQNPEDDDR
jgi:hypothetical protein